MDITFVMKERIIQIMQREGLSNADFAEKIGISTSSLSHIFSGRNNPSLDVVMRIHKACPYININWLLYGEGEMEEPASPVSGMDLFSQTSENSKFTDDIQVADDFRKDNPLISPSNADKTSVREEIRYIEKPIPKITEIRIFFDNGTYQTFKPEN